MTEDREAEGSCTVSLDKKKGSGTIFSELARNESKVEIGKLSETLVCLSGRVLLAGKESRCSSVLQFWTNVIGTAAEKCVLGFQL